MGERRAPQTIEELVVQYDGFIRGCINRISKGRVRPADVDDLRQQILTRVYEKDYLARFDPAKASFSSYLFWLIRSVVVNQFAANTRNPLNTALVVVESSEEDPALLPGTLVLEAYRSAVDDGFERRAMAKDLADQFAAHLAAQTKPWGPVITLPDGRHARRSLGLVFQLLRDSLEPKDVAAALAVAPGSVFGYLKRLRLEAQKFSEAAGLTV